MLVAMLATVAVRFQGVVLFAVLPTALLLKLAVRPARAREGRSRGQVVRNGRSFRSGPPRRPLGSRGARLCRVQAPPGVWGCRAASATTRASWAGVSAATRRLGWTLYHFAELPLAFGYIPACALLVLLGLVLTRAKTFSAAERSFLAVAAAATILLVPEVGVFASKYSLRIEERNMFALGSVVPARALRSGSPAERRGRWSSRSWPWRCRRRCW